MSDTSWSSITLRRSQITKLLALISESPGAGTQTLFKVWDSHPFPSRITLQRTIEILVDVGILESKRSKYKIIQDRKTRNQDNSILNHLVDKAERIGTDTLIQGIRIEVLKPIAAIELKKRDINPEYLTLISLIAAYDTSITNTESQSYLIPISSVFGRVLQSHASPQRNKKSIEKLFVELSRNEELGRLGEAYALKHEIERLDTSKNIPKIISSDDVAAGYDIESYESIESTKPDRFIEVKSISKQNHFFISNNEVEAMEALGKQSYLYLVFLNGDDSLQKIEMYNDPYSKIIDIDSDWTHRVSNYEVFL